MTTLGVLQYISPTIQLGLGVWLYHEPFGGARLAGFALIWTALALYSAEGWWRFARRASPRADLTHSIASTCAAALTTAAMRPTSRSCCVV